MTSFSWYSREELEDNGSGIKKSTDRENLRMSRGRSKNSLQALPKWTSASLDTGGKQQGNAESEEEIDIDINFEDNDSDNDQKIIGLEPGSG